jgi:hypothetical protein
LWQLVHCQDKRRTWQSTSYRGEHLAGGIGVETRRRFVD